MTHVIAARRGKGDPVAGMSAAITLIAALADLLNRIYVMWKARVIHWARTREAAGSVP